MQDRFPRLQMLDGFSLAEEFIPLARAVRTQTELRALMETITPALGFQYFAVIHHVDHARANAMAVRCENYPLGFVERFLRGQLYLEDPVLHATMRTNVCFSWEELPNLIPMTSRRRRLVEQGARDGVANGMTVPAMIHGEYCGSCTFATRPGVDLPTKMLPLVEIIGGFAFQAARRIAMGGWDWPLIAPLPPRERECIILAGQGKSNPEIASELGIGRKAVQMAMERARLRYDVSSRMSLVVTAVFHGAISLQEIYRMP